jgi:multimeric flavodoxin WrbA
MKITAVFGSPRKGRNSESLAEELLKEAERLGAKVERFRLSEMRYRGCIACDGCKTGSERCVLKDDLSRTLEAMAETDVLVIATPIYFGDMPSQMKGFVDRWYSFFKPNYFAREDKRRLAGGKTAVLVVTQGAPETAFTEFIERLGRIAGVFGFEKRHVIRGCQLRNEPDVAANRPALLELARETAGRVMAGEPSGGLEG